MPSTSVRFLRGARLSSTPKTNAPSSGCSPSACVMPAAVNVSTSTNESCPRMMPVESAQPGQQRRVGVDAGGHRDERPRDHLAGNADGEDHLRIAAALFLAFQQDFGGDADGGDGENDAQKDAILKRTPQNDDGEERAR